MFCYYARSRRSGFNVLLFCMQAHGIGKNLSDSKYMFNIRYCVPTKEDASLSGIDRDAMQFQGLDAIVDWLAEGHTSPRSDVIVTLSCLDIGFVSQCPPHAQIKAVKIPLISTCFAVVRVGCSVVFFAVFPKVSEVVLIYAKYNLQNKI